MKLNPQKCVFSVESSKFFGFMVTHRGIEASPEKIQVIRDMKELETHHGIQKLNGRRAALSRFLLRGVVRSLPFLKLLCEVSTKKATIKKKIEWDQECQQAFLQLKDHLEAVPLLN